MVRGSHEMSTTHGKRLLAAARGQRCVPSRHDTDGHRIRDRAIHGAPSDQTLPTVPAISTPEASTTSEPDWFDRFRFVGHAMDSESYASRRALIGVFQSQQACSSRTSSRQVSTTKQQVDTAVASRKRPRAEAEDADTMIAGAEEAAARAEAARAEAMRAEVVRVEAARAEAVRAEAKRAEAARVEAAREEAARAEAARAEAARAEAARTEAAKVEAARVGAKEREMALKAARREAANQEMVRKEAVRKEAARKEAARKEAAREGAAAKKAMAAEESRRRTAAAAAHQQQLFREARAQQQSRPQLPPQPQHPPGTSTMGTPSAVATSLPDDIGALISQVLRRTHDPFSVLSLARGAPAEVARKRYLQLVLRLHPDKCCHPEAQHAFTAVEQAYRALGRHGVM